MINILLISDIQNKIDKIKHILEAQNIKLSAKSNENDILDEIVQTSFDIVLIDSQIQNTDISAIARKIKLNYKTQNTRVLLILNEACHDNELIKTASGIIQEPYSDAVFLAMINSALRTKNSMDIMAQNNTELAKSLYQLDVLYKTSTQLAGSLDKTNLIMSMIEGVEKTLSFDFSYTLIFNDKQDVKLLINSLYPLTSTFEEAVKLRAILNYKMLFSEDNLPYPF